MGNSTSTYERHEDAEQQQRILIGKEFRLILGQVDLSSGLIKRKKNPLNHKQQRHRNISSSSSNSTITSSSSSDHQHSSVTLIQLDIPTSPFDSNELDTHAFIQYVFHQDSYGKELSHIFKIPVSISNNHKSRFKTLPTLKIAAVYYDQPCTNTDFNIEIISLLNENELEQKLQEFNEKTILSIYSSSITSFSSQTFVYSVVFRINSLYNLYEKCID
jgi:hypothetical protein